MLVLSRQIDETIMIGDDIEITLVDIRGDKVRIGIKAPASVPVHRKEVYLAIKAANEEAAAAGAGAVDALGALGGFLAARNKDAQEKGAGMKDRPS